MKKIVFVLLLVMPAVVFSQDLVITDYNVPTTFPQLETFPVEVTIQNIGTVPFENENNGISIVLYLSVDDKFEPSFIDHVMEYDNGFVAPPMAPGQSATVRFDQGYFDVPPGAYNLFIHATDFEDGTETNEDNNVVMVPNVVVIPGSVDLKFSSFDILPTKHTQNSITKITPATTS